uniref:Thiamin biosynthesis protein S n=1 Tax=Chondria sp. (in: red algae) TaxID=1982705 RepID=A0A1Z1MCJ9_9FLOR|nr:thiamin biosynthesis protein S [Chondria sp. (in: red algae)]
MQDYLTIFINGEPFHCDSHMSLANVLLYLGINRDNIVVEYNHQIISKNDFNNLSFKQNDSLEIITIVGGG